MRTVSSTWGQMTSWLSRSSARLVPSMRTALGIAPASTTSERVSLTVPVSSLFRPDGTVEMDWTGVGPVHECICGNNLFQVLVWFEDSEVAGYFTDAVCVLCGAKLKAPTLAD